MVNGSMVGFMVCEPSILDRITDDASVFESEALVSLASDGQLAVRKHAEFWEAMDTLRDRIHLENLWKSDKAPWKVWS